jgi:cytochrome c oxidase subunit 2
MVFGVMAAGGAAAGCVPDPATAQGRDVQALYGQFLIAAAVVGVVVWVPLTWIVLRYRRRGPRPGKMADEADREPLPRQTHGNVALEVAWTAIPAATIAVLFGLTLITLSTVQARAPQPAVEVEVEAFRWGWRFEYPRDGVTVVGTGEPGPEMVVPYGESIALTLGSADVQHAWYVPQFLVKHDVYPGRTARLDLLIERPGTYGAQCAEFCGLLHDRMPFTVRAVSPAEYAAWLEGQRAAARDAGLVPGHMP